MPSAGTRRRQRAQMPMQYYRELVSEAFSRYPYFSGNTARCDSDERQKIDSKTEKTASHETKGTSGTTSRSRHSRTSPTPRTSRTARTSRTPANDRNSSENNRSELAALKIAIELAANEDTLAEPRLDEDPQTKKPLADHSITDQNWSNKQKNKNVAAGFLKQSQPNATDRIGTADSYAGQPPPNSAAPSRGASASTENASLVGSGIVWINVEPSKQRAAAGRSAIGALFDPTTAQDARLARAEAERQRAIRDAVGRAVMPKLDRLVRQMEARRTHSLSREKSFLSLGSAREPSRYLILSGCAHSWVAPRNRTVQWSDQHSNANTMATEIDWERTMASTVNHERTVIPSEKEKARDAFTGLRRSKLTPQRIAPVMIREHTVVYPPENESRLSSVEFTRGRTILAVDRSTRALTILPAAPVPDRNAMQFNRKFVNPFAYYLRHINETTTYKSVPSFISVQQEDDQLHFHIPKWPTGLY